MYGSEENSKHTLSPYHNYSRSVIKTAIDDEEEKQDSELLRKIHPLLVVFLFTGLDFRHQSPRQRTKNSVRRETVTTISCALIHIISWIFALLIFWGAFVNENSIPLKQYIMNRFVEILIIFLRSVLYWRRKDIVNILRHLSSAYNKIKYLSKNLNRRIMLVFVIVYPGIYLLLNGVIFFTSIAESDEHFKNYVRGSYITVIPLTLSIDVYYLLGVIQFLFLSINSLTMCLLVILLLVVFTTLNLTLQDYFKSISSSGVTFASLQKHYTSVMNTIKEVDKCLSFPLFVFLGMHIFFMFFIISIFYWPANWLDNSPTALKYFFRLVFILYLLQYCAMTTLAAKVHENVQNIKTEVAKISNCPSVPTDVEQLLLISKINSHSNICLTLWGFMNITRNSVFSSFGALLTFGIVIRDI
ncbi:uncharacterized protein TNCT_342511 [Trichonephila clavata]|uniref:Gustatory receptor n=1 Tax=Trichonephila clavata TaxID=2740835 RepID=A0A8X6H777_TRICU|nr:uncharacterized protein TNCT_342511 [Trichonephila clavata]